jgi:hypothetical protein
MRARARNFCGWRAAIRNEVLATPGQTHPVRHALSIFAIIVFSALPIAGVALFGWTAFTALTLLCADLMILTMIGLTNAWVNAAPSPRPRLARVFLASVIVVLTAGPLAMSADRIQADMDLGMVLAQSELGVTIMLLGASRVVQYAIAVFISARPWRTGTLVHPLFAVALLLWFWRPGDIWTFVLLLALCIAKMCSEAVEHFATATERREASWLSRAQKRLSA